MCAKKSPGRCATLSSIAWLTVKLEVSGSGSAATSRSNVGSPHDTNPSGGFLRSTRRRFFGSSPALASRRAFSTSCSGACTTTPPATSKPARPARPAICANSRALRCRTLTPSYFDREVNTTVRIGTLMPTPRVSVPQTTLSRPACASTSTSRRYFGSIPAWCTPTPCRTSRDSVRPKPVENRNAPICSAIASFSSRLHMLMLMSACACSIAPACVGCTTYTGACPPASRPSTVSCSGVVTYDGYSGTGRSVLVTRAVSRPVRRVSDSWKRVTSPSVADISTNCACGSSSSGTCQAQPRSGSA